MRKRISRVSYSHLTIECRDCDRTVLNSASKLRKALREAASICKLHVLKEDFHEFRPHGLTAYVLLSESHISMHTWPEQGFAVVDVLSCSAVEIDSLIKCFRHSLKARLIEVVTHAQNREPVDH